MIKIVVLSFLGILLTTPSFALNPKILVSFKSPAAAGFWSPKGDFSSGGTSKIFMIENEDETATIEGVLENNPYIPAFAGFVVVNSTEPSWNLTDQNSIELSIKADGKEYLLALKDSKDSCVTWESSLKTQAASQFETIEIPLDNFKPRIGSQIVDGLKLNKSNIVSLEIGLREPELGAFRLDLKEILAK